MFQESNTPFSPDMIASHFLHAFIVVQVLDPNSPNTRWVTLPSKRISFNAMYSFCCHFVNKFPVFMKLQGSSPGPQKPVIRPHVEPADFSYSAFFFLHSCDRALWQILVIKPTRCIHFSNLFWNETLHVSDSSSVHHHEFYTVHTTMVYVIKVCRQLSSKQSA